MKNNNKSNVSEVVKMFFQESYKVIGTVGLAVVLCSILCVSCSQSKKAAIATVLDADRKINEDAPKIYNNDDVDAQLRRVKYIADGMQKIDLSRCPDDFARAFGAHRLVWQEEAKLWQEVKQYSDNNGFLASFLTGFVDGALGMGGELITSRAQEQNYEWKRLNQRFEENYRDMVNTYYTAHDIATKYGVNTSKYR